MTVRTDHPDTGRIAAQGSTRPLVVVLHIVVPYIVFSGRFFLIRRRRFLSGFRGDPGRVPPGRRVSFFRLPGDVIVIFRFGAGRRGDRTPA